MKSRLLILAALPLFLWSCENPFSPRGPFSPRLVVYSVLSNTRSSQFVRVYLTYNPPEVNPYEFPNDSAVTGADVRITRGGSFVFRDTVLLPPDGGNAIPAYVSDGFSAIHGTTYSLQVGSGALGTVRSTVTIPELPTLNVPAASGIVLDRPPGNRTIRFTVGLSSLTKAYLVRMFVEFETTQGIDTLRSRWQVPLFVSDTSFSDAMYPSVQYADRPNVEIAYPEPSYVTTLARIVFRYSILVKFKQVVFEVTQLGESLHTYSGIVNGFEDELSLRLDQPDYSNIEGGFGVFGAFTRDELTRPFPQDFFYDPSPRH